MINRALAVLAIVGAALVLSACGTTRLVDTEVSTFKPTAATAASTEAQTQLSAAKLYWLERLPSQRSEAEQRMAKMAQASLNGLGLSSAPSLSQAQLLVSLTTSQSTQDHAPFENPPMRTGFWFGTAGSGITFRLGHPTSNWYQRQLHWVFRSPSGEVLQEIKATHDGRWSDDDAVWQAMLNASLTDFPNAPAAPGKPRIINTDIPR